MWNVWRGDLFISSEIALTPQRMSSLSELRLLATAHGGSATRLVSTVFIQPSPSEMASYEVPKFACRNTQLRRITREAWRNFFAVLLGPVCLSLREFSTSREYFSEALLRRR